MFIYDVYFQTAVNLVISEAEKAVTIEMFEWYAHPPLLVRLRRGLHQDAYLVRRILNGAYPPCGANEKIAAMLCFWDALYKTWASRQGLTSPWGGGVSEDGRPIDLPFSDDVFRAQVVELKKRLRRSPGLLMPTPLLATPQAIMLTESLPVPALPQRMLPSRTLCPARAAPSQAPMHSLEA